MKYLIIFYTLSLFFIQPKPIEYISIIHIGASDKPIYPIIISKDNVDSTVIIEENGKKESYYNALNFIVNDTLYEKIKKVIINYKKNKHDEKENNEFLIYINDDSKYNYKLKSKNSIKLLNLLINNLETEKKATELKTKLVSTLKLYKKRL